MYPVNITDKNAFDVLCEKIREAYPLDVNDAFLGLSARRMYSEFCTITSKLDPALLEDMNSVIGTIAKSAFENSEVPHDNLMWSAKCHAVILFALRDWINTFLELMAERGTNW